jgi:hypothetical protein
MGGEIGATLLAASVQQISSELRDTKRELSETRSKLDLSGEALTESRIREAKLQVQSDAQAQSRNLKNVCLTAGPILLALSFSFYGTPLERFAFVLAPVGAVLTIVGWFPQRRRDKP